MKIDKLPTELVKQYRQIVIFNCLTDDSEYNHNPYAKTDYNKKLCLAQFLYTVLEKFGLHTDLPKPPTGHETSYWSEWSGDSGFDDEYEADEDDLPFGEEISSNGKFKLKDLKRKNNSDELKFTAKVIKTYAKTIESGPYSLQDIWYVEVSDGSGTGLLHVTPSNPLCSNESNIIKELKKNQKINCICSVLENPKDSSSKILILKNIQFI